MKKRIALIVLVAALCTCGLITLLAASSQNTETISRGVKIDGVDVSGLTKEEAQAGVEQKIEDILDTKVVLKIDGNKVKTTLENLGYTWENTDIIDNAVNLGKQGNVIKRYKDVMDIANNGVNYELSMTIDKESIKEALEEICTPYNVNAKNASLKRENNSFVITEEENGILVDVEQTAEDLYDHILNEWDQASKITLDVVTIVDKPEYTAEDCELVTDVLGSYYTSFTTYSSSYNRNKNIENGARLLNGIVLYPQEECSLNSHLEPWTEENGYFAAGTYQDGEVIDSLGGGICQVSSTLYNALLLAEIEIVERYPHSMAVSYVPLAADAALAGTYKDLVFKNNTDAPIYIDAAYSSQGTITFTVYGHETRAENRTIEYVSETISKTEPKTEVTKDPDQPKGYEEITSNGHIGYVAKLWKYIYEDGKQVDKILVNTSTYASSPIQKIVGTGKKEETTKKKSTKKETTTEEETTTKKSSKKETTTLETETEVETETTTEETEISE